MADDKLRILIEAVDQASKALTGVQTELARMEGSGKAAGAGVQVLGGSVGKLLDRGLGRIAGMFLGINAALRLVRTAIAGTKIEEFGEQIGKFANNVARATLSSGEFGNKVTFLGVAFDFWTKKLKGVNDDLAGPEGFEDALKRLGLKDTRGDIAELVQIVGRMRAEFEAGRLPAEDLARMLRQVGLRAKDAKDEGAQLPGVLAALVPPAKEAKEKVRALGMEFEATVESWTEFLQRTAGVKSFEALKVEAEGLQEAIHELFNLSQASGGLFPGMVSELEQLADKARELAEQGFPELLDTIRRLFPEGLWKELFGSPVQPLEEVKDVWGEYWEDMKKVAQEAVAGVAADLGGTLVDAALGAKVAWGEFFKQLLRDLARAIVQALIFQAIMTFFTGGSNVAGSTSAGGGGRVTVPESTGPPLSMQDARTLVRGMPSVLNLNVGVMGVEESFVEEIVGTINRLARSRGVQVLSTRTA